MQQRRIVITGVTADSGGSSQSHWLSEVIEFGARAATASLGVVSCAHFDLRDEGSIIGAAHEVGQETDGIDLLINSAGADARSFGASEALRAVRLDAATFNAILEVNDTGPMLVTRH